MKPRREGILGGSPNSKRPRRWFGLMSVEQTSASERRFRSVDAGSILEPGRQCRFGALSVCACRSSRTYTFRKTRLHIKMDIAVNVRNTASAKASLCGDLINSGTQIFLSTTSSYSHRTKSGSINISDQTAPILSGVFSCGGYSIRVAFVAIRLWRCCVALRDTLRDHLHT